MKIMITDCMNNNSNSTDKNTDEDDFNQQPMMDHYSNNLNMY